MPRMTVPVQPAAPEATPQPAAVRGLLPVRLTDPLRWLRAGWRDMRAAPGIALFYGVCFWLMAVTLQAASTGRGIGWGIAWQCPAIAGFPEQQALVQVTWMEPGKAAPEDLS